MCADIPTKTHHEPTPPSSNGLKYTPHYPPISKDFELYKIRVEKLNPPIKELYIRSSPPTYVDYLQRDIEKSWFNKTTVAQLEKEQEICYMNFMDFIYHIYVIMGLTNKINFIFLFVCVKFLKYFYEWPMFVIPILIYISYFVLKYTILFSLVLFVNLIRLIKKN